MKKVMLLGIMFILASACNVSPTDDTSSTKAGSDGVATNETHYCHDNIELEKQVRKGDGTSVGRDGQIAANVKVVVKGDSASVSVGTSIAGIGYQCVKYHGIPLNNDFSFKNEDTTKDPTGKGFHVEIDKKQGLAGNAIVIEWAETVPKEGINRGGADVLKIAIGNGLYNSAAGKPYYSQISQCFSASQEDGGSDEKKTDCVEYEYQQGVDANYGWLKLELPETEESLAPH